LLIERSTRNTFSGTTAEEKVYSEQQFLSGIEASAGLSYQLSERLNLRLLPTFRYGLLPIMLQFVNVHLWSAGFTLACYYQLSAPKP